MKKADASLLIKSYFWQKLGQKPCSANRFKSGIDLLVFIYLSIFRLPPVPILFYIMVIIIDCINPYVKKGAEAPFY